MEQDDFTPIKRKYPSKRRVIDDDDDDEYDDGMESCDEYDDRGILCHYSKTTGGWEPIEDHCVECGYDECVC
jgi:hypothetical protein